MKKRVVFYARVSTGHEEQLSALDNQIDWYYNFIGQHKDWELVDQYIDEGITGTSDKKRKQFKRMMEDGIERKEFDLIVTREVSRFARNTVDTLDWTRKLKAVGIGVYFVSDNIDTSDDSSDGELRLSIMATLAQDESRKTSNRVKAGLKVTRANGMILGTGNVLGYDRKGRNQFVINPEQAETVKRIYELYLDGNGVKKIKNILEKEHRKTATGKEKWQITSITRALSNPLYMGYQYQQQSVSDGYLTQKRVKKDKNDYILVKASHVPIISEEVYRKVQELKSERLTWDVMNRLTGKNAVKDIWVKKLICACGSSYKSYHWRNDTYGYTCNNQVVNGKKSKREKQGLQSEGYCDLESICDWKLEMLMWRIIKQTWTSGKEDIEQVFEIIKECYKEEKAENVELIKALRLKKEKLKKRADSLIEMRADGEITKEEYLSKKQDCEKRIERIEQDLAGHEKKRGIGENTEDILKKIQETMEQMIDFSSGIVDHDILNGLITRIVHIDHYEYDVYLNMGIELNLNSGAMIEEEKEIRIKRFGVDNIETKKEKHIKLFDLEITFEEAKAYRKMFGKYLRESQWDNLVAHVYL